MVAERFDVVVVGGGSAGIGAAVGASGAGARTLLVERYGFLGGAATTAGVLTYCGLYMRGETPRPAVAGAAAEVLDELSRLGTDVTPLRGRSGNWVVPFDPEALKLAADRVLRRAGAETWLHARLVEVARSGPRVTALRILDHAGMRWIEAGACVDASGEASLAAQADVELAFSSLEETPQPGSATVRVGGLPSGELPDRKMLARIAAVANAALPEPCIRPDGGVLMPLPGGTEAWWMCIDLRTDGLTAESLTRAEQQAREAIRACLDALRREPGMGGARLIASGPQFGIRETRRCATRALLRRDHVAAGLRSPEGVARGAWPMEVHEAPGRAVYTPVGGDGSFDIPLGTLHAAGLDNLWCAGRVMGADREAYGSIRVMGTAFATGQAAGVAAALNAAGAIPEAATVRGHLQRQGAII